jgi:hypothetical protein
VELDRATDPASGIGGKRPVGWIGHARHYAA